MSPFQSQSNPDIQNVGILALEIYFPSQYVDQSDLEIHDQVGQGKYTIGLGQSKMGFCSDLEDINSLCLTVVERLIKKHDIDYSDIGRLEVGTETVIDKSKSVKSVLMQLFERSGNTDVEGVDTTNACYGGTAALLNSLAWIESSSWDGRYALAVAGDIAVYASGSARPTGGAGAIAMLIGPNAPLVIESGLRATHMAHVYDFYKPDLQSEYPVVDGKLSIQCYLSALDRCYQLYCQKRDKLFPGEKTCLNSFDAFCFHSPYCKLVQKSLARIALNDFVREPSEDVSDKFLALAKYHGVKLEDTYFNRELEQTLVALTKTIYGEKTQPSLLLSNQVGNMYTPSLYGGLVSLLISRPATSLLGQRIGMFSYGSGLASTMYSLLVTSNEKLLEPLVKGLNDVKSRLVQRRKVEPKDFEATLKLREETHHKAPYNPAGDIGSLFPGTWYLMGVDDMHRRSYQRSSEDNLVNGALHD